MEKKEKDGYYWVDGPWRKKPNSKKKKKRFKFKIKIKRKYAVRFFVLVGLTAFLLIALAIFILIGEQYNLIQFSLGPSLGGLSPLDTWLIIILCIFGPGIFLTLYLTLKLKIIDVD